MIDEDDFYDSGRDEWANRQQIGQDAKIAVVGDPGDSGYGVGGTWIIAVVGPRDPGTGTPRDALDPDLVALFDQVSLAGTVFVDYVFCDDAPPSGYDVIVVAEQADGSDIAAWGSFANLGTPTIHARPGSWQASGITSAAPGSAEAAPIAAVANAAFEIPGAPGVVTFGNGGTVTQRFVAPADMPTGDIEVGTGYLGIVIITALPAGITFKDANVSSRKHVAWGVSLASDNSFGTEVWQTLINAILWLREP